MTTKRRRLTLYGVAIVLAAGLLFAGFGITIPPDAATRLGGASLIAGLGNFEDALAICDIVLKEHPQSLDARIYRATFLAQAQRFPESLAAYDDALDHAGGDRNMERSLRADRASVLLQLGRVDEFARTRADLARGGVDVFVHMLDGVAARQRGDAKASRAAFRSALTSDPDNESAKVMLRSTLLDAGRKALEERHFVEALDAFKEVHALYPEAVVIALEVAEIHLAMNQELDALRVLGELGLEVRGVAPLAFRAATALLEKGNRDEALDALAIAHTADAEATEALFRKDPAWAAVRGKASLAETVSGRHSVSRARLTQQKAVIASPGKPDK